MPQSLNELISTLERINFFERYPDSAKAAALATFARRYPLYQGRQPRYAIDYLGAGRTSIYPGEHKDCVLDAINCTFGILKLEGYQETYHEETRRYRVRMSVNEVPYKFVATMGPGGGTGINWVSRILYKVSGGLRLRNTGGIDYGEMAPMTARVWRALVKLQWAPQKYHDVASSFEGPYLSFGCRSD